MTYRGHLASLLPHPSDYRGLSTRWRADVLAGLTVGIVALPLALAFGVSSGAGAESGIITAIVAGTVAAICGGSHVQVSGPTGAMVVVLAPILAHRGAGALALVTLMAGAMVMAAGFLRLGRLINLIPWPVIEGFTLGIAVIIFMQQVPAAVGVSAEGLHTNAAVAAAQAVRQAGPDAWRTLAVAAVVALVMVALPRLTTAVPGSIVAIGLVTAVAAVVDLKVAAIGELPAGLPAPHLPAWDGALAGALVGPAAAVAALAAIESLLSARVVASHADVGGYDADRELVGQGLASIASGVFGGMPATGAIARTAVNVRAGGRTRLAAVVHSAVVLLVVGVLASVVSRIPLAALSGVLMVTAVGMVHRGAVRAVVRSSRQGALVFWLTAVVTVSVDLIYAVGVGLAVASVLALRAMAQAAGAHREPLPGEVGEDDDRIALVRLDGALYFGAAAKVIEAVNEVRDVEVVIVRMSQVHLMDATGAQVLTEAVEQLRRRGVVVLVKGIRAEHRRVVEQVGLLRALGDERLVFAELAPAVAYARSVVAST